MTQEGELFKAKQFEDLYHQLQNELKLCKDRHQGELGELQT